MSTTCSSGQVAAADVLITLYSTVAGYKTAWLHQAHCVAPPMCSQHLAAAVAAANTIVVTLCLCSWVWCDVCCSSAMGCRLQ
jgi:hypothetical protein